MSGCAVWVSIKIGARPLLQLPAALLFYNRVSTGVFYTDLITVELVDYSISAGNLLKHVHGGGASLASGDARVPSLRGCGDDYGAAIPDDLDDYADDDHHRGSANARDGNRNDHAGGGAVHERAPAWK